jgi:hypothetical protein
MAPGPLLQCYHPRPLHTDTTYCGKKRIDIQTELSYIFPVRKQCLIKSNVVYFIAMKLINFSPWVKNCNKTLIIASCMLVILLLSYISPNMSYVIGGIITVTFSIYSANTLNRIAGKHSIVGTIKKIKNNL